MKHGYKLIDFDEPAALEPLYEAASDGKPSKTFAVLNARFHEQEAFIVAQAGVPGAVTIATNMAGRGTDIQLGGNADMRIQQRARRHAEDGRSASAKDAADPRRGRRAARRRRWPPAASTSSAPSATRAGASTTSCAAARAARATPGARSSSCRCRTT